MPNPMKTDAETSVYLDAVATVLTRVLGDSLVAVYASGSLAFDDFERERSDIDLLAVARTPLNAHQRHGIREALEHRRLPCPAKGLDLALVTSAVAVSPPRRPRFDLALSTGHTWRFEVEDDQDSGELVLHLAICRQAGVPLLGPASAPIIGPVPRQWVLEELDAVLLWHAARIFDAYHDPLGQFSTLNACRAWYFAVNDRFCSKATGGEWVLARNPENEVVAAALDNRSGRATRQPDQRAVEQFLGDVRGRLRTNIS